MYWSQRLVYAFGLKKKADPLANFQGHDAKDRIQRTLLQNPAVGGDAKIVAEIMSSGGLVGFHKGDKIIEQGSDDNNVYFLLAGEADVLVNGCKITFRGAPNQIGEMVAVEPGKARSATVRARSETVCVWRISGRKFREVWNEQVEFKDRLQVEMASRHRERLAAGQVVKENMSLLWFGVSVGAAILVASIVWLAIISSDWTLAARSVSAGGAAIGTFLFFLLLNPAYIWRRSFSLLLWCLVGKSVLDTSISLEFSQGFGSLQLELLPSGAPTDIVTSICTSLAIIIVMVMCLWKDHKENGK